VVVHTPYFCYHLTPILGGLTQTIKNEKIQKFNNYFCEISTILSQFRVKVINILAMLQV
jgi:hypothetical protein